MEQLTPPQVANEWPVLSLRRQKDLRHARAIAFHRLGHRTIVYTRKDVEAFLKRRRVEAIGTKK